MSRNKDIEGYSVTIFVPVGAVGRRRVRMLTVVEARVEAEEIKGAINQRLTGFAWDTIDIEPQEANRCSHCNSIWTAKGDDFNGCCDADEEENEERKRDNGQLGVGA